MWIDYLFRNIYNQNNFMKILITKKQLKFINESVSNIDLKELENIVNTSNSWQKEYGTDFYKDDEARAKAINDVKKYVGIDFEDILDEYQIYLNSKNKQIANLIVSQGSPVALSKEMISKLIEIVMSEYDNIGSFRKGVAKQLIRRLADSYEVKEGIYEQPLYFFDYFLTSTFRRMANWIPDLKSANENTKKRYSEWCKNASKLFDRNYISPYWKPKSDKIIKDIYG